MHDVDAMLMCIFILCITVVISFYVYVIDLPVNRKLFHTCILKKAERTCMIRFQQSPSERVVIHK